MSDLMLWFLLGQNLASLPQLPPGTEVRLVSRDLLTVYGLARIEDRTLRFDEPLPPGAEIRLLVFPADSSDQERAQVLVGAQALLAIVSGDGRDVIIEPAGDEEPYSFAEWLREERGITLIVPPQEGE